MPRVVSCRANLLNGVGFLGFGQFSETTKLDETSSNLLTKGKQDDGLNQDLATYALNSFFEGPLVANRAIDEFEREK